MHSNIGLQRDAAKRRAPEACRSDSGGMTMSTQPLVAAILTIVFCKAIFAVDAGHNVVASTNAAPSRSAPLTITTLKGVTYENCRLLRVEPDGISYTHSRGIAKLFFSELPPEYAKRYGYNPQAARDYSQAVHERQAQFRQDQEDATARDLQDRGARLADIQANPKFTIVCRGGKGNTVGTGLPADGEDKEDISSGLGLPSSISAASLDNSSDTSPSQGGGLWEAVVSLNGIPVVLGTASSYEGANSILHEKGYAGQGYIHRKQ